MSINDREFSEMKVEAVGAGVWLQRIGQFLDREELDTIISIFDSVSEWVQGAKRQIEEEKEKRKKELLNEKDEVKK